MSDAVSGRETGEVYLLGSGKELFERRIVLSDGEVLEDATACIVDDDDGEAALELGAKEECAGVMKKGEISGEKESG